MSIPKLGSKDQLSPNDTATEQTGRNGLVTFFPTGTDQTRPAVISINGDNGGVDIGGTRDKHGKLLLRDKWMTVTYIIDGEMGETSQSGDIVLYDAAGHERVRISGKTANVTIKSQAGDVIAHLDGKVGDLTLGGQGQAGDLIVTNSAAQQTVRIAGGTADVSLGGGGQGGDVVVRNAAGTETIRLAGVTGDATLGGNGQDGDVVVRNAAGNETIRLDGASGDATLGGNGEGGDVVVRNATGGETIHLDGATGDATLGGNGQDGDVVVRNAAGNETIRLDGASGDATLGGNGQDGDVVVRNAAGTETIRLDGASGDATLGGNGQDGDVVVRNATGSETIRLDGGAADVTVGGSGQHGDVMIRNGAGTETIHIDGEAGDIILGNADAAEQFDLVESVTAVPGMLMVLNPEGKLEPSSRPYDTNVVGVVAGAGNYRPGIVLDHRHGPVARVPISVLGKVSCRADAGYGPIEVGSLLTTSPTAGHAMKAGDRSRAFGAVIGKALTPLREGVGLVDVLITLQ